MTMPEEDIKTVEQQIPMIYIFFLNKSVGVTNYLLIPPTLPDGFP